MRRLVRLAGLLALLAACGTSAVHEKAPASPAAAPPASRQVVLVAGATGSIGRHVVQLLLARGQPVRGLTRKPEAARLEVPAVEWVGGDLREPETLVAAVQGVDLIVFAAGSRSWEDPTNTPEKVDFGGVAALADLGLAAGVERLVLISSAGVTREWPNASAHLQDVLKWKGKAEEHVRSSGIAYTILRPYGIDDGAGGREGLELLQGDAANVRGSITREDLAAVAVACLFDVSARDKTFELINSEARPVDGWRSELAGLRPDR
jgi:uncharacterized protein YbjT (DUF2867 family)